MGIKLSSEIMQDILWGECKEGELIEDTITDHSRWSVHHHIVFSYKGKHYSAGYSCGATEMQDEAPWEYESEVECTEVKKVEKIVEVWEPV